MVTVGERLHRHLPVVYLQIDIDVGAADDRPPRHRQDEALGTEERPVARMPALDHDVAELEHARLHEQMHAADVHRTAEVVRGVGFGAPVDRGKASQVDLEEGDDEAGRDRDDERHQSAQPSPDEATLRFARPGRLRRRLGLRLGRRLGRGLDHILTLP